MKNLFDKACDLREQGKLNDAVDTFEKIIDQHSLHPKIWIAHMFLGDIYNELKNYSKVINNYKTATLIKPDSELASLGLYISLVDSEKYLDAIGELKRYLNEYPANHFKVTLEELLEDLSNGYATDFKETIISLAERNNIEIKKQF